MSSTMIGAREPRPAQFSKVAAVWLQRAVQRRQLAQLDMRLLRDLGLTHNDALAESSKWFWQA